MYMEKRSNKIWRIIWIIGIYALLVTILYLVVLYKVKWENKDLNKYLYFYRCSNELCTSMYKPQEYFSSIMCKDETCPYITEINGNNVILNYNDTNEYIYDYISGQVVNDKYLKYHFMDDGNIIVKNKKNFYGIIDRDGNTVIDFKYDEIISYKDNYLIFKKNGKIGIDNNVSNIHIDAKYDDISVINALLFVFKDNNDYYIASFEADTPVSNTIYQYLYATNGFILAIKDHEIDILDNNLKSKLLMKVRTYYSYKTEKERESLNIYTKDNYLYFTIFNGNGKYTNYRYDMANNVLSNT